MTLKQTVDTLLHNAVEAGDVPGVAAVAVDRDGVLYEGAFGVRTLGESAPFTLDTVCRLASCTKPLTSAAAMQLVEQGRLALDEPAERWLPRLKDAQVLEGFDADGKPRLRPPAGPVTLRHLLTHTAGFGYEIWNAEIGRYQQALGLPGIHTSRLATLGTPLLFDPGTDWNYGINTDLVGLAVEAASGQSLGDYMAANLLGPLGATRTGFRITPAMRERLARIHQRGDDGALTPLPPPDPATKPEFESGGGGLYGTVDDYVRFVRMILAEGRANGGTVLRPETVRDMARSHTGDIRVKMLRTCMPPLSNDAEFFPGVPKGWGLGFMVNLETAPTGRSAGSLAWAGLTNTYFWIDPAKGVGGVYFSQVYPFCDVKSLPLFHAFEKAVYDAL